MTVDDLRAILADLPADMPVKGYAEARCVGDEPSVAVEDGVLVIEID